jgi:hypothetical protein
MCKMTQEVGSQKTQRTDANMDRRHTNDKPTVLLGSADEVRESDRRKIPKLCPKKWILNHDNVPSPDASRVRGFDGYKNPL